MVSTSVLFALLLIASFTDVRSGKIYNWTTYTGVLIALIASALGTWLEWAREFDGDTNSPWFGFITIKDCSIGLAACGAVMLVCYLFFAGKVGGGDLKLIAMIGAFLGLYPGLESLLWTFVIAGCIVAPTSAIWKYGARTVFRRVFQAVWYVIRLGPAAKITDEEREPLQAPLHLAPSALISVVVVRFHLVEQVFGRPVF